MGCRFAALLAAVLLAGAIPARAAAAEEGAPAEGAQEPKRDHAEQGFVNAAFGTGFYLVAPKDKNDPDRACGWKTGDGGEVEGEAVCTGRSSVFLEILAGYGIVPRVEVFAILRLGLEGPERGRTQPRQVGAGIKVYSPADGLFKIGLGVAPLFDFSERYPKDLGYDFAIHVPIQFQFDILRWVGVYLELAPNVSFVTELRFEIAAGVGVQGRFP